MDTDLRMPIINKEPQTGYEDSLSAYTKSILFKIGEKTQTALRKTYKKDQLAETLREALLSRLEEADSVLSEKEWTLLEELAEEGMRTLSREDLPEYSELAEQGYVFVYRRGVDIQAAVPEEVRAAVKAMTGDASVSAGSKQELSEDEAALLKLYHSTKAIYGKANVTYLTKVWNDRHDVQFSVEDVQALIEND